MGIRFQKKERSVILTVSSYGTCGLSSPEDIGVQLKLVVIVGVFPSAWYFAVIFERINHLQRFT